jgi:AcrR family transcriptional regulator
MSEQAERSAARAEERRHRGLLPQERRADRRRRLIEAGLELFSGLGYHGTTIERVCARAGVTARHFYEEFPSREALLVAVYDEGAERAMDAVVKALAASTEGPRRRTRDSIAAFVHAVLDDPRVGRILTIEVVGVSADLERRRRLVMRSFARLVEVEVNRVAAEGHIAERDYRLAALALVGATNELVIDWILSDHRPPVDDLVSEIAWIYLAVTHADDRRLAGQDGRGEAGRGVDGPS